MNRPETEPAPCPLCGGETISPCRGVENTDPMTDARFPEIGIALCETCGLLHQNPRIRPEVMAAIYRSINDKAFATGARENPATRSENGRRLAVVERHLSGGLAGKRLLEIGSSNGAFLGLARSHGAAVQGIEPSEENAAFCRDRRGIPVFAGFLDEFPAGAGFDVVCHYFVLEHAFDPAGFLRKVRSLLVPGGLLFFEVPAVESFLAMPFAINLFPYQHISHFDRESVGYLLAATGFEALALEGPAACSKAYGMTLAARASDGALRPTGDPAYARDLIGRYFSKKEENEAALRDRVERFVSSLGRPAVAIYGAGENGRALLQLTRVRSLCSRLLFLDNSPAFVGTEIEGCPVVSPTSVADLGIDAAVLASIDYQEEMAKDLVGRGFPEERILRAYP